MLYQRKGSSMQLDNHFFNSFWHLVCHRRELQASGDYVRFDTPSGEVVVFNDSGNVIAFDNRCPHRGARIYSSDFGNQAASCKYHGWTYKNGEIIVPNKDDFGSCNIESAHFNTYSLDWCGDFIFLGIAPVSKLYDQLGNVAEILENISFNIDLRHDFDRYQYECYWPLAVENALEPYHISMVHPQTLATLNLENGENVFNGCNSIWYSPIGNSKIRKQLSGLKKLLNIDFQYEGYMSIYMFPFTMLSSTFGYSYSLQNFFPVAGNVERTNFTSRLLTTNAASINASQILKPFFDSTSTVNRMVFKEDHDICKIMPRDSWSAEPLMFPSDSERKIVHFRETCKKFAVTI
jgi:phenylpropionate dioxygenase-like ring-hydroxylating dioxygenase large terminal subunit